MKKIALLTALLWSAGAVAKPADLYLFYNSASENLPEIDISAAEIESAFDDIYGPASDELPDKVKPEDFYVAKFPDGQYVFTLKSEYNCGALGCATTAYERDPDGDLQPVDSLFPVKCKDYGSDKLLCIKGGFKVEKTEAKPQKRGPVHYPAPVEE